MTPMKQLIESVQYLTSPSGERNAVVVDIDLWEELVDLLSAVQGSDLDASADPDTLLDRAMWREEMAYRALYTDLYAEYANQYVAIYEEKLVDNDSEQLKLYLRTRQKYGDKFVLITKVEEVAEPVYTFRSPRVLEAIHTESTNSNTDMSSDNSQG